MAVEIKLHPLDFEPDVAIGIDLPLVGDNGSTFKQTYTTLDQAVANAKNLLLTDQGERIMLPTFGCNLKKTLFENLTEDTLLDLEADIRNNFTYWLPYIFINELILQPTEDLNRLNIKITISLEGNKFDTRSVELEININAPL
jgi:phage baseplate assembly protein W